MFKKWILKLKEGLELPCLFVPRHTSYDEVPNPEYTYRYEASTNIVTGRIDAIQTKAYCNYCGDIWLSRPLRIRKFSWREVVSIRPL